MVVLAADFLEWAWHPEIVWRLESQIWAEVA